MQATTTNILFLLTVRSIGRFEKRAFAQVVVHYPFSMAAGCSLAVSRHHRISHITLVSNGCYSHHDHFYHHLHYNMCNSTADTNVMAVSMVVVVVVVILLW